MKRRNLTRIFLILTALSIATIFGFQANSQTTTSFTFAESIEGRAPAPDTTPEEYDGPQTVKGLMNAFDAAYNQSFSKARVMAIFGDGVVYSSELAISGEIDARHSRVEWLHMLLQRGITIESFDDYRIYLSKRHTLAFLEDNPDLRKIGFLGIPLMDDREAYKVAYINKLVKRSIRRKFGKPQNGLNVSRNRLNALRNNLNGQRNSPIRSGLNMFKSNLRELRNTLKM